MPCTLRVPQQMKLKQIAWSITLAILNSVGSWFAAGFWAICGALFFNRTWRHSYFRFSDDIRDWIYVTTVIKLNWLLKSKESALVSERRWHWFSGSCSSKGQKELFAKDIS
nr:hypothetical protein CFP56_57703 [Quercus suber]